MQVLLQKAWARRDTLARLEFHLCFGVDTPEQDACTTGACTLLEMLSIVKITICYINVIPLALGGNDRNSPYGKCSPSSAKPGKDVKYSPAFGVHFLPNSGQTLIRSHSTNVMRKHCLAKGNSGSWYNCCILIFSGPP